MHYTLLYFYDLIFELCPFNYAFSASSYNADDISIKVLQVSNVVESMQHEKIPTDILSLFKSYVERMMEMIQ